MATNLIINYSKKLGLPGYSSHQFSISAETEVATTSDIPAEADRLYDLLQATVDRQMQKKGRRMIAAHDPPLLTGLLPPVGGLPNHISPTSAKNYLSCSLRFWFEKVA